MPRLTDKQRELLLADHHTGHYTQRELARKYDVSTRTVNNIVKGVEPKHTEKVNAIMSVARDLSQESSTEVNAVATIVNKKIDREKLIFGNAEKLANKLFTMADQIDTPNDLKTLAEANDKLAVTLKVAERHANSQVTVNTQNNVNQEHIEITKETVKEVIEDFAKDI